MLMVEAYLKSYQPLVTSGEHAVTVERVNTPAPQRLRETHRAGARVVYWDPE